MAISDNILLKEASGTIGNLLTLTLRPSGKTVMGKKRKASSKAPSEKQLLVQSRFKKAQQYAKAVMEDSIRKAAYAAIAGPDQSAFNMALKDAFRPPVVESITTTAYQGAVGDTITIQALDDFKVVAVKVIIRTATGDLVEQGNAVAQPNGLDWLYTATAVNDDLPGTVITATAVDTPGNETPKEAVL